MPSGGKRPGAGRKSAPVKRVAKTYRLLPAIIERIAENGGAEFIERLVYESSRGINHQSSGDKMENAMFAQENKGKYKIIFRNEVEYEEKLNDAIAAAKRMQQGNDETVEVQKYEENGGEGRYEPYRSY